VDQLSGILLVNAGDETVVDRSMHAFTRTFPLFSAF
jgi:hypothetical protein